MMKRIFCFILAIVLCFSLGCGKKATEKDTSQNQSVSDKKTAKEQIMEEKDLLTMLTGEYMSKAFFDEFESTKSMISADKYQLLFAIQSSDDGYSVIVGDGHQGDFAGNLKSTQYIDGKYELYFERDEDNNIKITYTPDSDILEAKINFYIDVWSTNGETYEFLKFDDEAKKSLVPMLFEGIADAAVRDGDVYVTINEEPYRITILTDLKGEPIDTEKYNGILMLTDAGNNGSLYRMYKYDNGKISLFDNDNLVAEFK